MGTSFIQPGEVMEFTAPTGGVVKGTGYLIGNAIVIALDTVAQTLPFRGALTGVHASPKTDSQAWTVGQILYYDSTNKVFTTVSTSNFRAGFAAEAVGSGAGLTIGKIRLAGIPVTAVGGAAP